MKYVSYLQNEKEIPGILAADGQSVHALAEAGLPYPSLLSYIQGHSEADIQKLQVLAEKPGTPLADVQLLAPIPHPHHDIICVGLNYMSHVEEAAQIKAISQDNPDTKREDAIYFSKRVITAVGPEGTIEGHYDINERLDYEAELGVVIGKTGRHIEKDKAWDHVFGLCCFNDISGRDLQQKHKQWYFGKSLDGSTVFGPYIASLDEFSFPLSLRVQCRVNGETRQDNNTDNMIFPVDYIINELSQGITLDAGSIIATGTPAGVGAKFEPHRCMRPGDVCEVEIDGCGILKNHVK